MSLTKEKQDILALFNLEDENIEDISFSNENNCAAAEVLLRADYPPCPDCGNTHVVIKCYQTKVINHGLLADRKCVIVPEDINVLYAGVPGTNIIPSVSSL